MFKVGEKVVYPAHGVGVIQSVQTRVISGTEKTFYMLRILENDMTIMIPTENVASVGLRRIIGKDTVNKVYRILRERRDSMPFAGSHFLCCGGGLRSARGHRCAAGVAAAGPPCVPVRRAGASRPWVRGGQSSTMGHFFLDS